MAAQSIGMKCSECNSDQWNLLGEEFDYEKRKQMGTSSVERVLKSVTRKWKCDRCKNEMSKKTST